MSLIQLQQVSYSYTVPNGSQLPALHDITLRIPQGEYLVILGHNGSGKSTLARLLNGVLGPTTGRVIVDGFDTASPHDIAQIRRRVGLVFQSPDNQIIANTVEEDVAFGPENLGLPRNELHQRVEESLTAVGMWELRRRPPHALSAGQKQRVAIAGVLAMRPRYLVLDEITAMLDPAGRRDVLRIIRTLHGSGTTIVAITHQMEESLHAERIAVLHEGALALTGTPQQVFADPVRLHELRLALPPAAALAHYIQQRLPTFPTGCLTADELADAVRRQLTEVR